MSTASILPAAARRKRRFSIRRLAAWLAASASDPGTAFWLVSGFAALHAVLWTVILVNLKTGQDIHMDVAEAFGWGQKFLLGYGKHPPLSGWVAGLWFRIFPVTDWATYALAMATLGCGLVICWLLALRVVDHRRAFLVVVMLALYPIFNFKGFKYNPDLLQLVTLPLRRAGLSRCVREAQREIRTVAWAGRRAGADDQILGADHDRRHRPCGADPSAAAAVPALAGAVGRDIGAGGGDDPAFHLAEAGGFRAVHLCRRYLFAHRPPHDRRPRARICRP